MPKRVFWPLTLVLMGLIFLASNLGYLPAEFWNLWPLILIIVGLGGLLTADREEWLGENPGHTQAMMIKKVRPSKRHRSRK